MRLVVPTALALALLAVGACVPDFKFGDGAETSSSGDGDGDGGDGSGGRRGRGGDDGDGGRNQNPTGKASASASTGPGPAGPSSTQVAQSSSASSAGGDTGEGATTTATGEPAASTGTGAPTESTPCFQGDDGVAVECSGTTGTCCIDMNSYADDGCVAAGTCDTDYAWSADCNEPSDCPGALCCMNLDILGDFLSYTCDTSCFDAEGCDPLEPDTCSFGSCQPRFQQDAGHPEYDHYGFCD